MGQDKVILTMADE